MSTALEAELMEQLKVAMKGGDKVGTMAIRMIRTKLTELRTAKNAKEVTEEVVVDTIRAYSKQLQGSIDELKAGGADEEEDNIVQMKAEIGFLARFLPQLLSKEETEALVDKVLAEQGISDPKMAGKVTGLIMKDWKGKADPGVVAAAVKAKLGG